MDSSTEKEKGTIGMAFAGHSQSRADTHTMTKQHPTSLCETTPARNP